MRIRLMGPAEVAGQDELQLRDRTVLEALVVRRGSAVPVEEIVDALWGASPPTVQPQGGPGGRSSTGGRVTPVPLTEKSSEPRYG